MKTGSGLETRLIPTLVIIESVDFRPGLVSRQPPTKKIEKGGLARETNYRRLLHAASERSLSDWLGVVFVYTGAGWPDDDNKRFRIVAV